MSSKFYSMISESTDIKFRYAMESHVRRHNMEMWEKMDKVQIDMMEALMDAEQNEYDSMLGNAQGYGY